MDKIWERKKNIILGKLAEYFSIPEDIDKLKDKIRQIEHICDVKGVSFDKSGGASGISNDEKLSIMVDKINDCENKIQELYNKADSLVRELHLYEFTDEELDYMRRVGLSDTYEEVGDAKGYGKQNIGYKMGIYYKRIDKAMQKDKGIE